MSFGPFYRKNNPYASATTHPQFTHRRDQAPVNLTDPRNDFSQMLQYEEGVDDSRLRFLEAQHRIAQKRSSRSHKGRENDYRMMPRTFPNPMVRSVPESTRETGSRIRLDDQMAEADISSRTFDQFKYAPYVPSAGDVGRDPRYAIQTKGAVGDYQLVRANTSVFKNARVAPTGGLRPNLGVGFEPYSLY